MNLTGLAPEITEYISRLETQLQVHSKTVESQQVRIDQLTTMLLNRKRLMKQRIYKIKTLVQFILSSY